jgi:hypothetical protein
MGHFGTFWDIRGPASRPAAAKHLFLRRQEATFGDTSAGRRRHSPANCMTEVIIVYIFILSSCFAQKQVLGAIDPQAGAPAALSGHGLLKNACPLKAAGMAPGAVAGDRLLW